MTKTHKILPLTLQGKKNPFLRELGSYTCYVNVYVCTSVVFPVVVLCVSLKIT